MSTDINKIVEHIRKDVCKDCEHRCGLCDHGVCEDVVLEVGAFFLFVANKENEEQ